MTTKYSPLFNAAGLRDTQPRRLVLNALEKHKKAVTPHDLQVNLAAKKTDLNIVTLYRILEAFEKAHIVHKHPCNGAFSLCTIPAKKGHHGFLHCNSCNTVEEFSDEHLCHLEHGIAKKAGFAPHNHVSEIMGTCRSCQS